MAKFDKKKKSKMIESKSTDSTQDFDDEGNPLTV